MRELHIIIKAPDDGNPLDMLGKPPVLVETRATIGYRFLHADGNWYGDYISVPIGMDQNDVKKGVDLVMNMAYSTEDELFKKEQGYYDNYGAEFPSEDEIADGVGQTFSPD